MRRGAWGTDFPEFVHIKKKKALLELHQTEAELENARSELKEAADSQKFSTWGLYIVNILGHWTLYSKYTRALSFFFFLVQI